MITEISRSAIISFGLTMKKIENYYSISIIDRIYFVKSESKSIFI